MIPMKLFSRIWAVLGCREEDERRHGELMRAVSENRKAIQKLESTVRVAVREMSDTGRNGETKRD